jgi:DNA-binding transcriptional LysR family regulator
VHRQYCAAYPDRAAGRLPQVRQVCFNDAMGHLDSIEDLRLFDGIVRAGSLSGAAQSFDVSLTLVSKRLKRLEATLGVRLVQRTTRQLQLTEEGEEFLQRCRLVLDAVEAAEEVGEAGTHKGVVRVTAAVAFAQRHVAPRLPRFLSANPGVSIQLIASNELLDLIGRKVDVALRQAPLTDSRLIMRPLVPDAHLLCASPAYLARYGMPACPSDLAQHACLTVGDPPPSSWTLYRGQEVVEVSIKTAVGGTDGEICHAVALADGGIAMKATWDVLEDIQNGRLVRVLPEWWGGQDRWVRLVYPSRLQQPRRVRAFIAFMEAEMRAALVTGANCGLFEPGALARMPSNPVTNRDRPLVRS